MFLSTIRTSLVVFSTVVLCNVNAVAARQEQHSCALVSVEISQSNETTVIGSPIATKQTIQEFYNFNGVSFRGHLPTGPNTSLIALHQDTGSCDTSIVVVHSQAGSGAALGWGRMQFEGVNLSSPTVKDDSETFLLSDQYQYNGLTNTTTVTWNWGTCCSDGLAHVLGKDWEGCLTVEATFASQSIQKWLFVSGTAMNTTELRLGESLTLCANHATPKPSQEPSTIPSLQHTDAPSASPSEIPSNIPSSLPSMEPSIEPSSSPSSVPTRKPTFSPTTFQPSTMPPKQQAPKNQPTSPATSRPILAPMPQPATKNSPSPTTTKLGQDTTSTADPTASPTLRPVVFTTSVPTTLKQEDDHCSNSKNCRMWNLSCRLHYFLACGLF